LRPFIPYENLLDLVDKLEVCYKQSIGGASINEEVYLNQFFLAVDIMV
jgi:hypothetical protein